MRTITDKEILDDIVAGLDPNDATSTGKSFASYEDLDTGLFIDACVQWHGNFVDHYITIDGVSYHDFSEWQMNGFSNLSVEAFMGKEKVEIDTDYINDALYQYL